MSQRSYPRVFIDPNAKARHGQCQTCGKFKTRQVAIIEWSYMRGDDAAYFVCHACRRDFTARGLVNTECEFEGAAGAAIGKDRQLARAIEGAVKKAGVRAEEAAA